MTSLYIIQIMISTGQRFLHKIIISFTKHILDISININVLLKNMLLLCFILR